MPNRTKCTIVADGWRQGSVHLVSPSSPVEAPKQFLGTPKGITGNILKITGVTKIYREREVPSRNSCRSCHPIATVLTQSSPQNSATRKATLPLRLSVKTCFSDLPLTPHSQPSHGFWLLRTCTCGFCALLFLCTSLLSSVSFGVSHI